MPKISNIVFGDKRRAIVQWLIVGVDVIIINFQHINVAVIVVFVYIAQKCKYWNPQVKSEKNWGQYLPRLLADFPLGILDFVLCAIVTEAVWLPYIPIGFNFGINAHNACMYNKRKMQWTCGILTSWQYQHRQQIQVLSTLVQQGHLVWRGFYTPTFEKACLTF